MLALGRAALILAPMEGVTDAPMRALMTERGGFSFCVSEFFRISQDVPPARTFYEWVPELRVGSKTPAGVPVQVQLLGGDPEKVARAAAIACALGSPGVDLNFGCPAPTVNRHDGGATLLKFPERIRAIVAAVRAAVPAGLPVSAKLRLGWDTVEAVDRNAAMAAEGGASWIAIHARTRVQGYMPPVNWGAIGRVRAALGGPGGIPIVANGDIWSLEDFRRCRDETGCEHFMLGRGALADPELPLRVAEELGVAAPARAASAFEWLPVLRRFSEICLAQGGREDYPVRRIKQWGGIAQKGALAAGAARDLAWFAPVKRATSLSEIFALVSANESGIA